MNRQEKELEVKKLSERFGNAKAMIFAGYRGLKVSEFGEVRSKLRAEDVKIQVVKNRLAKRALTEKGMEDLCDFIDGPTTISSSEQDPVAPAKILMKFAKEFDPLEVRGGVLDGKLLSLQDIETLAKLPSRDELLAKMLGSVSAPAQNMAGVLAALPRQLVTVIDGIRKTKE